MPARNLPALTNVHNANSRIVQNYENRGNKESNVFHLYENELASGSGHAHRRPRESSRGTGGSIMSADKVSQHPMQLPAVQTNSATSNRSGTDNGSGVGDRRMQASSPNTAVEHFGHQMSSYEHREVFNYTHVYFVGPSAVKRSGAAGAPNNDGYDDDNGTYLQVFIILFIY